MRFGTFSCPGTPAESIGYGEVFVLPSLLFLHLAALKSLADFTVGPLPMLRVGIAYVFCPRLSVGIKTCEKK